MTPGVLRVLLMRCSRELTSYRNVCEALGIVPDGRLRELQALIDWVEEELAKARKGEPA